MHFFQSFNKQIKFQNAKTAKKIRNYKGIALNVQDILTNESIPGVVI